MASPVTYSVHPAVAMVVKWIAELKAKTGRSMDEWVDLIRRDGPLDEKACRAWIKDEFQLGHFTAVSLAERSRGRPSFWEDSPEQYLEAANGYVATMFAGPKRALLPLYERLLELGASLGDDVKFCPCKTIVPFYCSRVFAQVKPSTKTRIDFGFALGDRRAKGRLIDTGGFAKKDRITHRIEITSLADIDGEVERYLTLAYERDAE